MYISGIQNIDMEEERYRERVSVILSTEGHVQVARRQAGFDVIQYNGVTFVSFDDPCGIYSNQQRTAKVQAYQEALSKHGITLKLYQENPSIPTLIGFDACSW